MDESDRRELAARTAGRDQQLSFDLQAIEARVLDDLALREHDGLPVVVQMTDLMRDTPVALAQPHLRKLTRAAAHEREIASTGPVKGLGVGIKPRHQAALA